MDGEAVRRERSLGLRGIYVLVDPARRPAQAFVRDLIAGGVRLVQVRAKNGIAPSALMSIVAMVRAAGGLTLVNDDVEAATFADGVHLGQEDAAALHLPAVRRRLGQRIIGLSCGTPAEARAIDPVLIDYIGIGPMFATGSKADAGLPIGVDGVRAVVEASTLPAAAIGGIDLERLPRVRETGAVMAAVLAAADSTDVTARARALVGAWTR